MSNKERPLPSAFWPFPIGYRRLIQAGNRSSVARFAALRISGANTRCAPAWLCRETLCNFLPESRLRVLTKPHCNVFSKVLDNIRRHGKLDH